MGSSSDLLDEENWRGGSYELGLKLSPTSNDGYIQAALTAFWELAPIEGCSALVRGSPIRLEEAEPTLKAAVGNPSLVALVTIPNVGTVVGMVSVLREEGGGADWIFLGLPMGALERLDARVGGYPMGKDGGPSSLEWRRPIDEWLADICLATYERVPFVFGAIGFDVGPHIYDLQNQQYFGMVEVEKGRPRYVPASK